jgi:hypothetical protein
MELPPWLNFSPQTFVGAAETGRRLQQSQEQIGLEGERVGLERERLAQSAGQATAQLGMEGQRLAAQERQAMMEAQIHRETILSNFQRAQTQAAMTQAYHQATLGIAKNRLDLEGQKLHQGVQTRAKEISDTVGYANAVATGTPPLQARAQFPLAKLPATEEKPVKPAPMSDYDKTLHSTLATAYKDAIKTGDMLKIGPAAKQLREFDEKKNPQGLVQPPSPAGPQPTAPVTAPAGNTGFIGTPGGVNQFSPTPFQSAQAGTPATAAPQLKYIRDKDGNLVPADQTTP